MIDPRSRAAAMSAAAVPPAPERSAVSNEEVVRQFIAATEPLESSMKIDGRIPLYLWPAMDLADHGLAPLRKTITDLVLRGVAYVSTWDPTNERASLDTSITAARYLEELGHSASIHLTPCVYGVYDGGEDTLHRDEYGNRFSGESFGGSRTMGCPFCTDRTVRFLSSQMRRLTDYFSSSGRRIGFAFADWEIDGPIEWNGTWESSKRCVVCREHVPDIDDFRAFQKAVRAERSRILRTVMSEPLLEAYPDALVSNYGVYPHDGYRYWYDYFEEVPDDVPSRKEGTATFREWVHEYEDTGLTAGMPVVYSWKEMWDWANAIRPDVRWLNACLRVIDNAGKSADASVPLVTFVHRGIVGEKKVLASGDTPVPLSREAYRQLLCHLMCRGHRGMFVWTPLTDAFNECIDAYSAYRTSLLFSDVLVEGTPCVFGALNNDGALISAVKHGEVVLTFRSDHHDSAAGTSAVVAEHLLQSIQPGFALHEI